MINLELFDFQTVSGLENADYIIVVLSDKVGAKISTAVFRKNVASGITPTIRDGTWWIGEEDTEVAAEGMSPVFRKGELGIEWKYSTEDDSAWRLLVNFADITWKFDDLTDAQKQLLIPHLKDFTAEEIAELQQPATEMISKLEATNTKVTEAETSRVNAENARVAAEKQRESDSATAVSNAKSATSDANSAAKTANDAAKSANDAAENANDAAAKVTTAITDISKEKQAANDAADKANTAAENADSQRTAAEKAEAARVAAENARVAAENSRVTAENSRVAAEKQRVSDSAAAITNAESATKAANTAAEGANSAASKANSSASSADKATETLNTVKTECASAQAAANSAAQSAEEKIVEMESLMKNFSGEGTSAPVKMVVTVPESISIRCNVKRSIVAVIYPTYLLQNVIFQRADGDSLRVDPSGGLTVKGIGETTFYVIPTQNTPLWQEVTVRVRPPRMRLTSTGKIRLNGSKIRIV
jgi:hypothetical protein